MSPSGSGLGGVGREPGAQPGRGSGWMRVDICLCDLKSLGVHVGETSGGGCTVPGAAASPYSLGCPVPPCGGGGGAGSLSSFCLRRAETVSN